MFKPTPKPHAKQRKSNALRPFERRAAGAYPFFRIAEYRPELLCYRDDPKTYPTYDDAVEAARKTEGKYRITIVLEDGTQATFEPFLVSKLV